MNDTSRRSWLPEVPATENPRPAQRKIIQSDQAEYPIRVIAGAGTGKTFTMIRTVEHLIDAEGVSPGDILAITFTNKAADSMRGRLQTKLGRRGYDVTAATYHSICHRLLSEYAYYADLDPEFEIATEAEKYLLILESLDDLTYRFVEPEVHDRSGWGRGVAQKLLGFVSNMKRTGIRPHALEAYLGDFEGLLEMSELPERIEAAAEDRLRGTKSDALPTALTAMEADLEELRQDTVVGGDTGLHRSVEVFLEVMIDTCRRLGETYEDPDVGIGEGDLTDSHKLPAFLFGTYSSPPKGIPKVGFTLPDLLNEYLQTCQVAADLTEGYGAYERQLASNQLIDFDDAIIETAALLDSDVGDEISGRWQYVVCDEFQDTDPLQFDLIQRLVTDDRLFVVGDDDQAIYGWRGAEIDNIKRHLEDAYGASLTDKELTENFRSRQPILDLANTMLSNLEGRVVEKSLQRHDEPDYHGDTVATVTASEEEEDWGDQLCNVITHLLAGETEALDRSYDPGDIAILTRKHKHADPIVQALEDAGIPYERAGGSAPDSVGVQTVISYLRALANPREDEVSLSRVLLMRYRLPDADLRALHRDQAPLIDALVTANPNDFEASNRVAEARDDLTTLLALRDRYSVARLYRELKRRTNIMWYLSDQERRDLWALDRFVAGFGDDDLQPRLDKEFIEVLDEQDDLATRSTDRPTVQPEIADDAVNVMTIYKAKGLDFPVVIIPELTADEWEPRGRQYDRLHAAIRDEPAAAVTRNVAERDAREARRVLHVGLTRAEEVLVLAGRDDEEGKKDADPEVPLSFIDDCLSENLGRRAGGPSFSVWSELQAALPDDAADWTDSLAAAPSDGLLAEIRYEGDRIAPSTARERLVELGRTMVSGELDALHDGPLTVDRLESPVDPRPAVRHSHTSLEVFEVCPRQHYMGYVVDAVHDPPAVGEGTEGPTNREIGILFHEVAERAVEEELTEKTEWYTHCERLGSELSLSVAVESAQACIDRFFETEAAEWEFIAAELQFGLTLNGHTVTGLIDAIAERPNGEFVVADYKATSRTRSVDESAQLPLYLLAARRLLNLEVETVAYVFVGEAGPAVDYYNLDEDRLASVERSLLDRINAIEAAEYADYTQGNHCEWCPHRSLPCGRDYLDASY